MHNPRIGTSFARIRFASCRRPSRSLTSRTRSDGIWWWRERGREEYYSVEHAVPRSYDRDLSLSPLLSRISPPFDGMRLEGGGGESHLGLARRKVDRVMLSRGTSSRGGGGGGGSTGKGGVGKSRFLRDFSYFSYYPPIEVDGWMDGWRFWRMKKVESKAGLCRVIIVALDSRVIFD